MNQQTINDAFAAMIGTYRIHTRLGITRGHVKTLRHQVRRGIHISLEKKIRLLKKSGWREDAARYTEADLVDLARTILASGAGGRTLGADYLVDKWKRKTG